MGSRGKAEAAAFLIRDLGANRHAVGNGGRTALHVACSLGHTELALMLVRDFGLHLEATDNQGSTALMVISLINNLGARVDVVIKDNGSTALHEAAAAEGFTHVALACADPHRRRAHIYCQQMRAVPRRGTVLAGMATPPTLVSALLAEAASLDDKLSDGRTPQ